MNFDKLDFDKAFQMHEEHFKYVSSKNGNKLTKAGTLLYVLLNEGRYPDADNLPEDVTLNSLLEEYFSIYNETRGPSRLGRFEVLNDILEEVLENIIEFYDNVPGYELYAKRRNLVRGYLNLKNQTFLDSMNICRIDSKEMSKPDAGVVAKMNLIDPQMTGYFFEYLIALELECFNNEFEYINIDRDSIFNNEELKGIYQEMNIEKEISDLYQPQITEFENKFLFILYYVILHMNIIEKFPRGELIENVYRLIELIKDQKYYKRLENYSIAIKRNSYFRVLKLNQKLLHGQSLSTNDLNIFGEIDFMNDNSIIDIKCVRKLNSKNVNLLKEYFYQIFYYAKLKGLEMNKVFKNGIICNLLTNEMYSIEYQLQKETEIDREYYEDDY